jgi:hypothetical protein
MKKSEKNRTTCVTIFFVLHCRLRSRVAREAAKLAAEFAVTEAAMTHYYRTPTARFQIAVLRKAIKSGLSARACSARDAA